MTYKDFPQWITTNELSMEIAARKETKIVSYIDGVRYFVNKFGAINPSDDNKSASYVALWSLYGESNRNSISYGLFLKTFNNFIYSTKTDFRNIRAVFCIDGSIMPISNISVENQNKENEAIVLEVWSVEHLNIFKDDTYNYSSLNVRTFPSS